MAYSIPLLCQLVWPYFSPFFILAHFVKGSLWVLKQKGELHAGEQAWMSSQAIERDGEVALTGFFPSPVSIVPKGASIRSHWANNTGTHWDVKTPLCWWLFPLLPMYGPCWDLGCTIYYTESPSTEFLAPFCLKLCRNKQKTWDLPKLARPVPPRCSVRTPEVTHSWYGCHQDLPV